MEMDPKKYKKEVEWSDEDQCFIAKAPQLPGAMIHGDTEAEALKNLDEVIIDCLEFMSERALETIDGEARFLLRMPNLMREALRTVSNDLEISINELILNYIQEGIKNRSRSKTEVHATTLKGFMKLKAKAVTKRPAHSYGKMALPKRATRSATKKRA